MNQMLFGLRRETQKKIDLLIFVTITTLFLVGLVFLFSALINESHLLGVEIIWKGMSLQVLAFALGVVLLLIVSLIDTTVYLKYFPWIALASIIGMLLLLTPLGIESNGAVRWLDLGFITFQPSEVMKFALIIFFAALFSGKIKNISSSALAWFFVGGFLFLALATVLQPDYGTSVIICLAIFAMMLVSNLSVRLKMLITGIPVLMGGLLVGIAPDYIGNRLSVFYDVNFGTVSEIDRYGDAYHTLQNLESVKSGGLVGDGLNSFAQTTDYTIPEITTDSIFALVASEVGFIGSSIIIIIFLFLMFLFFTVAQTTRDTFARLLVVGISTIIGIQFFINLLVVLGLPSTGVPLLFFSRGGSALLVTLAAVGVIRSVLLRSKQITA